MRFGDVKVHPLQCELLHCQHGLRKPHQPLGDVEGLLMLFQLRVIGCSALFDGKTQQDQTGLAQGLREGLFCQRPSQTSIAVFKRVDAFKPDKTKG